MTGRFWTAEEAFEIGGVDRLAPPGEHLRVAEDLVRNDVLTKAPLSVRALVEARRGHLEEIELKSRLRRPRDLHLTEDFREAATAFVEKRAPVFRGR
jgi:enoyl-CoA hydratase/carnithine racemase